MEREGDGSLKGFYHHKNDHGKQDHDGNLVKPSIIDMAAQVPVMLEIHQEFTAINVIYQ
jgi:hypothetical protein